MPIYHHTATLHSTCLWGQGNVYVKFRDEDSTAKAVAALQGRFYNGRPIAAEFSPVTDFREATVRCSVS
jgi:hypothetical protein